MCNPFLGGSHAAEARYVRRSAPPVHLVTSCPYAYLAVCTRGCAVLQGLANDALQQRQGGSFGWMHWAVVWWGLQHMHMRMVSRQSLHALVAVQICRRCCIGIAGLLPTSSMVAANKDWSPLPAPVCNYLLWPG